MASCSCSTFPAQPCFRRRRHDWSLPAHSPEGILEEVVDQQGISRVAVTSTSSTAYPSLAISAGKPLIAQNEIDKNLLLRSCANSGRLEDARWVFDSMLQQEASSWATMVAAYAQNGHPQKSLQLFQQMDLEGVKPNAAVLAEVLTACTQLGAVEECKQIYARILSKGLETDVQVGSALIRTCAKCRSVDEPRTMFRRLGRRDVYSWTSMLVALAQVRYREVEAIKLFQEMELERLKPDRIMYAALLGVCTKVAELSVGRQVHGRIVAEALESDASLGIHLINMYSASGSLEDAIHVFEQLRYREDVVLWTSMIAAYVNHGYATRALKVFQEMDLEGVKPNAVTFTTILVACLESFPDGVAIHKRLVVGGFESNFRVSTALLNMYGRHKQLLHARSTFDRILAKDVFCWTSMISAYAQQEQVDDALMLYRKMQVEGLKPNEVTLITMLDLCATTPSTAVGRMIHLHIAERGFQSKNIVGNSLINMYAKCGSMEDARKAFEEIRYKDAVSWSSLIAACFQNSCWVEAIRHYRNMSLEGVKPTDITIVSILNACAGLRSLARGKEIHEHIAASSGLGTSVVIGNTLIYMYDKCGSLEDARRVFDGMQHKGVVSWTVMVAAYAQDGHMVFKLLQKMQQEGVRPNSITFTNVLAACSHARLLEEGHQCFISICRDHEIPVATEHYGCMVELLGAANRLDEAEELVLSLPFEPSAAGVWKILLSACKNHNDVQRATRVVKCLLELEPDSIAPQILLTDIYAAEEKTHDPNSKIDPI